MDLFAVDRAVAAAVAAHRRAGENTAWEAHRSVSGQRALREIEALSPSAIDAPLAAALARHIARLTVLRVSQDVDVRAAEALRDARAVVRLERDERLSYAELFRGLLTARSAREASAYFSALPELGPALAEPLRTLRQTREEILLRLGIGDHSEHFLGVPHAALVSSARAWLAASHDLARDVTRRRRGGVAEERWPIDLDVRLARDASAGWPGRLSWRSVSELFQGLPTKPPLELGTAPTPAGAASFARALFHLGASFRRAGAARGVPYSLREPAIFADALRTGAIFAAATMERSLHVRALHLGSGQAADQARTLARSALLTCRLAAGRLVLEATASGARGAGSDWEELTAEVLGAPLPRELAGIWPRASETSAALWLAIVTAPARYRELREREGDDWFRNPRAFESLRERFGSVEEAAPESDAALSLARDFEELLG